MKENRSAEPGGGSARSGDGVNGVSPAISVLIPCLNEEAFIEACLDSLVDDYVRQHAEVLVIDGLSDDRTREIVAAYRQRCPNVRLIDNPERLQSSGLNVGLREARGTTIVRADAHSEYPPGYVRSCVKLLERVPAANVGGVMAPRGRTPFEVAVASAMSSRVGIGFSRFHLGDYSGYTDTVYLGTFRREIVDRVGGFDPAAHPAEDAELNARILAADEKIYLDSSIRVYYKPRSSVRALAKQFFWYGRARCYLIQKRKRLFTAGRLLPPLLVLALLAAFALAPIAPATLILPAAYLAGLGGGAIIRAERGPGRAGRVLRMIGVLATMHLSYGTGFLLRALHVIR
jgi:succinoglycan biosynthesis protein ExoA